MINKELEYENTLPTPIFSTFSDSTGFATYLLKKSDDQQQKVWVKPRQRHQVRIKVILHPKQQH